MSPDLPAVHVPADRRERAECGFLSPGATSLPSRLLAAKCVTKSLNRFATLGAQSA